MGAQQAPTCMRYRPAAPQFWKCFELTADGTLSVAGVPRMRHYDRGCPILAFLARVGIREACSEGFRPETVEKRKRRGRPMSRVLCGKDRPERSRRAGLFFLDAAAKPHAPPSAP